MKPKFVCSITSLSAQISAERGSLYRSTEMNSYSREIRRNAVTTLQTSLLGIVYSVECTRVDLRFINFRPDSHSDFPPHITNLDRDTIDVTVKLRSRLPEIYEETPLARRSDLLHRVTLSLMQLARDPDPAAVYKMLSLCCED
jgi:hypothetical protein